MLVIHVAEEVIVTAHEMARLVGVCIDDIHEGSGIDSIHSMYCIVDYWRWTAAAYGGNQSLSAFQCEVFGSCG